MIKFLHLIAQTIGKALDGSLRTDAVNLVAHLQMQILVWKQRHTGTKNTRDVDTVVATQMQLAQAHSVDLIL